MKTPSEMDLQKIVESPTQPGSTNSKKHTAELINKLFEELKAAKPGWRASFLEGSEREDEIKRQYVKCFIENKVADWELVEKGLAVARKTPGDFFPAPGTFLGWCKGAKKHHEHLAVEAGTKEFDENRKLLESKPRTPGVAQAAIENMKKQFGSTE